MVKLDVPLAEKTKQGRRQVFTWPRTQTEAIQFLFRSRIKSARRSPPHFPPPVDSGDDDDKEEDDNNEEANLKTTPEVEAQDPQFEEGSWDKDEYDIVVQEESSVKTQYERGIDQDTQQLPPLNTEAPAQHDQTFDPIHISVEPIDEVNLRWCVEGLNNIFQ